MEKPHDSKLLENCSTQTAKKRNGEIRAMRNRKMIPFEVVEKAVAGEPEAINAVLYHYRGYIKYRSVFQGHVLCITR